MNATARWQAAGPWLAACRPGFLLVTVVGTVVGIAQAQACGCGWDGWAAAATVVLAVLAHAAINLYNDYGDAVGGSDAINTGHLFPLTGGSRMIQNNALNAVQVRNAAQMLALIVGGGGVVLAARSGPGLLLIGIVGLSLGWAYSSPKVALMTRGLGEASVAAGWWLIVIGASYVQTHALNAMAAVSGVSFALLVAAILWAAEFPDAQADAAVGKRTLVVRLGARRAAWGYVALVLAAHAWAALWWWIDWLPTPAWWSLASLPLSAAAAAQIVRNAENVQRLRPAIVLSIAAAILHGVLLAAAFFAVAAAR